MLADSDHQIFQKWLEAAHLANACAEHIGWGTLPRLDHKLEVTHAQPKQPNTQAKSQWSPYCNQIDDKSCQPASQSAVRKSQDPARSDSYEDASLRIHLNCTDSDIERLSRLAKMIIRVGRPVGK